MTKPKVISLVVRQHFLAVKGMKKKIKEKPIKMFFIDKNINIFYFATFSHLEYSCKSIDTLPQYQKYLKLKSRSLRQGTAFGK